MESTLVLAGRKGLRCAARRAAMVKERMGGSNALAVALLAPLVLLLASAAGASEAELKIPDLGSVSFLGIPGHSLLLFGLLVCIGGMIFGLVQYMQIRSLPVHKAMAEISELIYETCKTYLSTQGKFIAVLWAFIGIIIVVYFGLLQHLAASSVEISIVPTLMPACSGIA